MQRNPERQARADVDSLEHIAYACQASAVKQSWKCSVFPKTNFQGYTALAFVGQI